MASQYQARSIHQLQPLESGGEHARRGFAFQDHIAASFYLALVSEPRLKEVWCETQDDITLIWDSVVTDTVEFVQVKDGLPGRLWSVATLCSKSDKRSVFERSLQYDRCTEPCFFRVVTAQPTNRDLRLLTYPLCSPERTRRGAYDAFLESMHKVARDYTSENGHDASFWIRCVLWQVEHDITAVLNQNLLALQKIVDDLGVAMLCDQRDELYQKILVRAMDAAKANFAEDPKSKKCTKPEFTQWLSEEIAAITTARREHGGARMAEKMEKAGLTNDTIYGAHELRRFYIKERRSPQYLDLSGLEYAEKEVLATLQYLKSQLDSSELADNGLAFHRRCLDSLRTLRQQLPSDARPSQFFLDGCMYSIADRCIHRFRRAMP